MNPVGIILERMATTLGDIRAGLEHMERLTRGRTDVTDNPNDATPNDATPSAATLSDPMSDKEVDEFLLLLAAMRDLIGVPRPRLEGLEMVAQAAKRYRTARTSAQRQDACGDLDVALAELEAAG